MKNYIICENCGTKNPHYSLNCKNCKSFLRSRIVNIDFWKIWWKIFESPVESLRSVIYAENKNFVSIIILLAGFKFFIHSLIISQVVQKNYAVLEHLSLNMALSIGYTVTIVFILTVLITALNRSFGFSNRFKDNLAVYVYSFIPQLFALFFFVPVEYAIFGKYWFFHNPSPFEIKETIAWILIGMELLMLAWTFILSILATYAQTKNKIYSIIIGILFSASILLSNIYLPLLPI